MPNPPYAKVLCSVNGGGTQTGGITVPSAASIALSGENTSQWGSQLWQIYDYPVDFTCPSGWSTDANGVYFSSSVTPPSFSLPTLGTAAGWGKYMLRLTVNGGTAAHGLVDESTSLTMLSPSGLSGIGFNESQQFGGARSAWSAELNKNFRAIEASAGGGGSSADDPQKSLQVHSPTIHGHLKSLEFFSREDVGRLHVKRIAMTGGPELIFESVTKTITRASGSFVTDGFTTGPLKIRNISAPYQTANNGDFTITLVTASTFTIAETPVDDDIASGDVLGDNVTLEQGGHQTIGLPGQAIPDVGARRVSQMPSGEPSRVLDAAIDNSGNVFPLSAVSRTGEMQRGSTFDAENSASGTVKRPPIDAAWADLDIKFVGREQRRIQSGIWRDRVYSKAKVTSSATPDSITWESSWTPTNWSVIHVRAESSLHIAFWLFRNGVLIDSDKPTGTSGWDASVSGTTVTIHDDGSSGQVAWYASADPYANAGVGGGSGGSVADDIAKHAGSAIDRVRGFRGVPLDGNDGDAPPIGGAWTYNEQSTNSFKAGKPKMPGHFDVRDYGAVGDFDFNTLTGTDDHAAFVATLAAMAAWSYGNPNQAAKLICDGQFYLSNTLEIRQTCVIQGTGRTTPSIPVAPTSPNGRSQPGSALVFPSDVDGLRFHSSIDGSNLGGAEQSVVRDLTVYCKFTRGTPPFMGTFGVSPNGHTGHGIHANVPITLDHVWVENFAENGIFISGGNGAGGSELGNADGCLLINCTTGKNGANGLYFWGNDAQAGTVINLYHVGNWGWGVWDNSSSGNTYIGCDAQGNMGETDDGSLKYSIDARNHDYKNGSATFGANASCFYGCYTEAAVNDVGGRGNGEAIGNTLGQSANSGFNMSGGVIVNRELNYKSVLASSGVNGTLGYQPDANVPFTAQTFGYSPTTSWAMRYNGTGFSPQHGWWGVDWFRFGSYLDNLYRLPGTGAIGRVDPHCPWMHMGVLLGDRLQTTSTQLHISAASPPTATDSLGIGITYEIGDVILNPAPTAGSKFGVRAVVSGTEGTLNSGSTTGDIGNTGTTLTVNSATHLYVGCYISIAGVTGPQKVTAISGLSITVTPASDATVTGAAVSYYAPTFEDINTDIAASTFSTLTTKRAEVRTSSTSPTTIASWPMADETCVTFAYEVTMARRTNVTKAGTYRGKVTYKRTSGTTAIVGSAVSDTDQETTAGDGVAFNTASNTVTVDVTAADSDGRNWYCRLDIVEVGAA